MDIRLRSATEEDASLLFQWRNDPDTANNSINKKAITWEEHKSWFDSCLRGVKNHILIGYIGEDHPVGMIRFNQLVDGYEVSITIDPYLRARGIGRMLLQTGLKSFAEGVDDETMFATIRGENVASLIIFLASGFQLVEYNQVTGLAYLKREPK